MTIFWMPASLGRLQPNVAPKKATADAKRLALFCISFLPLYRSFVSMPGTPPIRGFFVAVALHRRRPTIAEHDLFRKPVFAFRDHALCLSMILFRKPVSTFRDHALCLSMIFSENRYPLFGIMLFV